MSRFFIISAVNSLVPKFFIISVLSFVFSALAGAAALVKRRERRRLQVDIVLSLLLGSGGREDH